MIEVIEKFPRWALITYACFITAAGLWIGGAYLQSQQTQAQKAEEVQKNQAIKLEATLTSIQSQQLDTQKELIKIQLNLERLRGEFSREAIITLVQSEIGKYHQKKGSDL